MEIYIKPGDTFNHDKYGNGVIIKENKFVNGVTIEFPFPYGKKTILKAFVELQILKEKYNLKINYE